MRRRALRLFVGSLLLFAGSSTAQVPNASHVWFPLTSEPLWAELEVGTSSLRMGVGPSYNAWAWREHMEGLRLEGSYRLDLLLDVYYLFSDPGGADVVEFSSWDPLRYPVILDQNQRAALLGGTLEVEPIGFGFLTWPPLTPRNPYSLRSGFLARVGNTSYPRELASDPLLWDAEGSPAAGPSLGGTAVLRIRCKGWLSESLFPQPADPPILPPDVRFDPNALVPDDYQIGVFSELLPTPAATALGTAWVGGDLLGSVSGRIETRLSLPGAPKPPTYGEYRFPVPLDLQIVGTRFYVQGICGGRASNALGQRVTWTP